MISFVVILNVTEGGVKDLLYLSFNIGANAPVNQVEGPTHMSTPHSTLVILNVTEGGVKDLLYLSFNIGANAPVNQSTDSPICT